MPADVMVTARMSREKKEAVAQVLDGLGTTASEVINDLYDYVRVNKALPFAAQDEPHRISAAELSAALSFIDGLGKVDRFSSMTDEDIKRERMLSRGLMTEADFA